jgi:peptidoglycan/LPS O-acetylase OafA/YrhL
MPTADEFSNPKRIVSVAALGQYHPMAQVFVNNARGARGEMNPPLMADQDRIIELDGVRGLAISLVLYAHFVPYAIAPGICHMGDSLRRTLTTGATGVDLFFILSGFLIGGILMDQRDSDNYFKAFYIRRCCRILPPYLLLLASYLILKSLLGGYSAQAWFKELFTEGGVPFWANLTFCQNYVSAITGHYNPDWLNVNWSLAMEEQFYLVLPLAIWLLRPSLLVKILVVPLCLHPLVQLFLCIFYAWAFIVLGCALPCGRTLY